MKLNLLMVVTFFALIGCNESTTSTTDSDSTSTAGSNTDEPVTYAYTLDHPNDWDWGSKKNVEVALNALKGYETGNIDGTMQYWADSVTVEFDNFEKKLSNDSLMAMFKDWRSQFKDVKVQMDDWESVVSKDKEWEWVSLWYKQYNTNNNGVVDSVDVMDDIRFKNGKIVLLNEKTRKLGPPKK